MSLPPSGAGAPTQGAIPEASSPLADAMSPEDPDAIRRALPLHDRRLPKRTALPCRAQGATQPLGWAELHSRIQRTVARLGFRIEFDIGHGVGVLAGRHPPWVRGLVIAERSLRINRLRGRRRLGAGATSLVLAFGLFGFLASRGLPSDPETWTLVLLGVGFLALGLVWLPSFRTFDSEVLYVQYEARASSSAAPAFGSGETPRVFDVTVGCGSVVSCNWYSDNSKGRRILRVLPSSERVARVPAGVVRGVTAATLPLDDSKAP